MLEIIPEKKSKFPLFAVLFITASLISLVLFVDQRIDQSSENDQTSQEQQPDSTNEPLEEIDSLNTNRSAPVVDEVTEPTDAAPKALSELTYSGWIPVWDFADAISNMNTNDYPMESVSPVWYGLNEDGSILDRRTASSSLISQLEDKIAIIPTIAAFDADILHKIFDDPQMLDQHIDEILSIVEQNDYDGIDLDYEMIYKEDKASYMYLLQELGRELRNNGKILSVTVLSKWGADNYSSFPETRYVQNYEEINDYVDEIRIMCYDYTSLGKGVAGPIGPIDWIDSVLRYATKLADSEKIVLGIHLYGYRWDENGNVAATTYDKINDLSSEEAYSYEYNHSYEEGVAEYIVDGINYTHFFQTEEGVLARTELAREYDIKGVVFWRLGRESSILNTLIEEIENESL